MRQRINSMVRFYYEAMGGFVSSAYSGGNISNCYSTGSVSGSLVGGFAYFQSITVTNCFWDTQTSGQNTSAGGTGKTTLEMKNLSTFINVGWDFDGESTNGTAEIWDMDNVSASINNGYPFLAWQNGSSTAVSYAPMLASIEGTALAYNENDAATAMTSAITVSDGDDTNIESATIQITGNYQNGQDVLSFTNQNGITGTWTAATGTISLTGSATLANYQTALRDVKYNNTSDNPNTSTRTVSITIHDGDYNSNTSTRQISVAASNDTPILSGGTDRTFTENDPAQALSNSGLNTNYISGLSYPAGLTFDAAGNLYVAQFFGTKVSKYNSSGVVVDVDYITGLNIPSDLAFDASGNLYVAQQNTGKVSKYNSSGGVVNADYITGLSSPYALAFDASGNLYVAQTGTQKVSKYNSSGGVVNANYITGLSNPAGLAFDASGNLYVAQYGGAKVSKYNSSGVVVNADYITGLNGPYGLAFDASGNLYVAQYDGAKVSKYNSSGVIVNADYITGLSNPAGLALDVSGNLSVSQHLGGKVSKFSPGITVQDVDSDDFNVGNLTLSYSSGGGSGDVLAVANQGTGSGQIGFSSGTISYEGNTIGTVPTSGSGSGLNGNSLVITFNSANATLAAVAVLLNAITYQNTSDAPSASRTVSITLNDGDGGTSSSVTLTINVTPVNDAPVLAAIEGTALAYTEGDAATSITSAITVADADDTNIESATIQITGNYQNGQDVLSFTNQNGISGTWTAATGTMALSGSATKANYQTALRDVKYNNTSDNPNTSTRTVSFTVNDEDANSNIQTRQINITAVNQAPVLASIEGTALSYTESDPATVMTNTLTVSDVDNANISSAAVSITVNYQSSEDVLSFTNQNGISGSYNSTTGVMTLSGSSTKANYQTALRDVKYSIISDNPSTSARTVSFTVNDGTTNSNILTRQINITGINNTPILETIEAAALGYTEGNAATAITNTLTVSDTDSPDMSSATVSITGNYRNGEDVLSFTNQNGITGTWNNITGVMTLNGSSIVANYQTALRAVKYSNTSKSPSTLTRTISFTVNDGDVRSDTSKRQINVTAVNNAPIISFQFRPFTFNEDSSIIIPFSQIYPFIKDPDNAVSTLKISFENAGKHFIITELSDTLISIASKKNWYGLDSITVKVSDGFSTTSASFAVDIISVNDLPTFTNVPDSLMIIDSEPIALDIFNLVSDVETSNNLLKFEFNTGNASLLYNYDSKSGILNLSVTPGYSGKTKITVKVTDGDGGVAETDIIVKVDKTTSIKELSGQIPTEYQVYQNYPNPFNPSTIIRYGLPEESKVVMRIYNILGQEVQILFNGTQKAGFYEEIFNGSHLTSGMYIYTLIGESAVSDKKFSQVKKMLLIK